MKIQCFQGLFSFNSRPHKEVDGTSYLLIYHIKLFQFTTSQGGRRRSHDTGSADFGSFNSRPHKEVDSGSVWDPRGEETFNSRPHKEVDDCLSNITFDVISFNSRPHKEVDILDGLHLQSCILSIHDLTRRSTTPDVQKTQTKTFQFTTSQGGRPG